jgi:hypothetical protein
MSKLTIISSKEMMKIIQALGFNEIRQKGVQGLSPKTCKLEPKSRQHTTPAR